MRTSLPRFLLLGGPPPEPARRRLDGLVQLVEGNDPNVAADGVLLPADADVLPMVKRYRAEGGRLPIFVVAAGTVDVAQRIHWIREGVDDLFGADTVGEALTRRLRNDAWRPLPSANALDAVQVADRVDRWLRATNRYLVAREDLLGDLGPQGRARFLDASFLRDQVLRAGEGEGVDPFGQRRGSERESLNWPVQLLAPVATDGRLQNVGADGVCLGLPSAPGPGERLQLSVTGDRVTARLELEVRWQRRVARGRWQVGAFGISCQIERGG